MGHNPFATVRDACEIVQGDPVDPLSDVLAVLDVRAAQASRFEAAGEWSLQFYRHQHVKVGAVLQGSAWLHAAGGDPVRLSAGECYLLTSGRPYVVASDLSIPPVDGTSVFEGVWPDTVYHQTEPGDPLATVIVGGAVTFDQTAEALLMDSLPGSVRIAADSPRAEVLVPTLQMLAVESANPAPGSSTMLDKLTQILFVQALRTLLLREEDLGWLGALNDKHVGAALTAIHRRPEHRWTVAELAAEASMSRSAFAERFRELVGLPPLDYLSRWRMRNAVRALQSTDRTVASIGAELGYSTESAFSTAFKRVTGHAPTHYRR